MSLILGSSAQITSLCGIQMVAKDTPHDLGAKQIAVFLKTQQTGSGSNNLVQCCM